MNRLPLILDYRPAATLLHTAAGRLSQAAFLGQAAALAQTLPPSRYVVNLCESRLAFLLGFAAALLRGQASLLPPNKTTATLAAIRAGYSDSYLLSDGGEPDAVPVLVGRLQPAWSGAPPAIDTELVAALPFTSGSTGEPIPHAKTWGRLVLHSGLLSQRLGFAGAEVVATVPPQHTYGLETTVLAALAGGAVSHHARPFFPADVLRALAALPSPGWLVTTPVHLQALILAGLPQVPLAGIVSATAPLRPELAAAAEERLGAPLHEIYGATESGALATRRTATDALWQPLPQVSLRHDALGAWAAGPHLDGAVRLADRVEVRDDGRFLLVGRSDDLLKVAGKRMSLAELNHRLLQIPGVEDGVAFLPEPGPRTLQRPAALVVAPGLSERQILDALRGSVDPAFLPRPLRRVERLPRNELGKLPQAVLRQLLRA